MTTPNPEQSGWKQHKGLFSNWVLQLASLTENQWHVMRPSFDAFEWYGADSDAATLRGLVPDSNLKRDWSSWYYTRTGGWYQWCPPLWRSWDRGDDWTCNSLGMNTGDLKKFNGSSGNWDQLKDLKLRFQNQKFVFDPEIGVVPDNYKPAPGAGEFSWKPYAIPDGYGRIGSMLYSPDFDRDGDMQQYVIRTTDDFAREITDWTMDQLPWNDNCQTLDDDPSATYFGYQNQGCLWIFTPYPTQFTDEQGVEWVALGQVAEMRSPNSCPGARKASGYTGAEAEYWKRYESPSAPFGRYFYVRRDSVIEMPEPEKPVGSFCLQKRDDRNSGIAWFWRNNDTGTFWAVPSRDPTTKPSQAIGSYGVQVPGLKNANTRPFWGRPSTPQQIIQCCKGGQTLETCGVMRPQSSQCDQWMQKYCGQLLKDTDNFNDQAILKQVPECSCFRNYKFQGSIEGEGFPSCFDADCQIRGYKTNEMLKASCPTVCKNVIEVGTSDRTAFQGINMNLKGCADTQQKELEKLGIEQSPEAPPIPAPGGSPSPTPGEPSPVPPGLPTDQQTQDFFKKMADQLKTTQQTATIIFAVSMALLGLLLIGGIAGIAAAASKQK